MKPSSGFSGLVLGTALTVLGAASASANIVYTVSQSIGLGSVTGTITTDGATGVLSVSDILAWDLTLNGVGASFNLTSISPIAQKHVIGNDLIASPTDIYFNFSGTTGDQFLLQNGGDDGQEYWCNSVGNTSCYPGKSDVPVFYTDSSSQFDMIASGNQIIATSAGAVPEPSTWAMMLFGFVSLGLAGYRASRKVLEAA
jgi:PEP-CTERM motif